LAQVDFPPAGGSQHDPQVEPGAPIVDVPKIVLDAALHLFELMCLSAAGKPRGECWL
jgi:hypothetical protein